VTIAELVAEHGSPLWLARLDRAREAYRALSALLTGEWDDTVIAYSYKTNRLLALLDALTDEGAYAEVVCDTEYAIARDILHVDGDRIIVNGPGKSDAILALAARDGALVICDAADEFDRAAAAGVRHVGLRVNQPGALGAASRFGIPSSAVLATAARARRNGLSLDALAMHIVSTDFLALPDMQSTLAGQVRVTWPRGPEDHMRAAQCLGRLVRELGHVGWPIPAVDIGGGLPPGLQAAGHVRAIAGALRAEGFTGRLTVEPGRALVAAAVDLVCSVVAVKKLADGRRAVVVDAGTNLVPGALWSWPEVRALSDRPSVGRAMVCGPLCLNIDVVHPGAELPDLGPGDLIAIEGLGAYQQAQSTQFGDARPAVMAYDGGQWTLVRRRERLSDIVGPEMPVGLAIAHPREEDYL
jgi:diaminopimelate decarboxylase